MAVLIEFDHQPSAISFIAQRFASFGKAAASWTVSCNSARWRNLRVDRNQLDDFLRLTGLRADAALPMIYPHVFGLSAAGAVEAGQQGRRGQDAVRLCDRNSG
jgi:hypothetical protein